MASSLALVPVRLPCTPNIFISASARKPRQLGKYLDIPTTDVWALWLLAKASKTNTSPNSDSCLATSSFNVDSNLFGISKNLVFSNNSISPGKRAWAISLVLGPKMSVANFISLFKSFAKLSLTGSKVFLALSSSLLTRPKWLKIIILQFSSYLDSSQII